MARASISDYLATGMDHCGYLEPEVTSSSEYPDYIQSEVEAAIEKLQQVQGYHTATFGFVTDVHYATKFKHTHLIRLRRMINAYKGISKAAQSDFLAIGGDHVTNGCKKYVSDCYRALRSELDGVRYMPVNGNHDDNSIWDISFLQQEKAENDLTLEERYTLFYNGLPQQGAVFNSDDRGLYYYADNEDQKIRFIFLDTGDLPHAHNEKGGLAYPGQHLYSYSQSQLTWLTETALRFEEDGWCVVVIQHVPSAFSRNGGEDYSRIEILHDILTSRKNGTDLCVSAGAGALEVTAQAAFSTYRKCEIACVLAGHTHTDDLLCKDGIWYATIPNSVMYRGSNPLPRNDGDKTELVFDMVTVDRKKRKVTMIRVGSGEDREFTF